MKLSKEYNENMYMAIWFKMYKKSIQKLKVLYCNDTFLYRSFSPQVVEFMFKLAKEYRMDSTVKYKCVELYDKYLCNFFWHKYKKVYIHHPKKWPNVLKKCKEQSCLRIMSCMQLLLKYEQASIFKMKDIKSILKQTGHIYTKKEIRLSESKVFHIVDYKLNETSIFMLVKYFIDMIPFHITNSIYSTCLMVTDFVYIYQQEIYDRILYQKTGYRNCTYVEKLELLNNCDKITIAAAVVVTAFYILNSSDKRNEELCEYLSTICEESIDNLFTISSIIIFIINSICIE